MTVAAINNVVSFLGSGTPGPFSFAMRFFENSEITAQKQDSDRVVTTLAEGVDYTLSGALLPTGGVLTLTENLNTGESLIVSRTLALDQPTSIRNQGAFFPEIHEDEFDRLCMQIQQTAGESGRALRLPLYEPGYNSLLPAAAGRENKVVGFDATGALVMYDVDATSYLLNLGVPVGNYASLNAAVAALGSANSTLVVNTPCVMTGNLTVPANVRVLWIHGGWIDRRGYTLAGLHEARPQLFGAVSDGVTDDAAAVQSAFAASDVVRFSPGTYKMNSGVLKTRDGGMLQVIGEGNVVLDATDMPAPSIVLDIGGTIGSSAALAADAALGDITITTTLAVATGDIIRLKSTESWSSVIDEDCDQGELAQVRSVSGTTVTLTSSLMDSYNAATTTVYRLNSPRVEARNFRIIRAATNADLDNYGMRVKYAHEVLMESVQAEWHSYGGISILECFGAELHNCKALGRFVVDQGNCYGLAITASQRVKVFGGNYHGGRHGITHGGHFPCRDVTIVGATLDNECHSTDASNPHSLDSHSGCQNLKVLGCTINNGAWIGASDVIFEGNSVFCRASNARRDAVRFQPGRSCSRLAIRNNHIRTSLLRPDGTAIINYGIYIANDAGGSMTLDMLDISGNHVTAANGYGIYITSGTSGNPLTITSVILNDNYVKATGTSCNALHVQGNSSGSLLTISNIAVHGGRYQSAAARALNVSNTDTTIGTIRIKNLTAISGGGTQYAASLSAGGNLIIEGNTMAAGTEGTVVYLNNPGMASIKNNIFSLGKYSISAGSSVTSLMIDGNQDATTHRCAGLSAKNITGIVQAGRINDRQHRLAWYSGVPTVGTWEIGDVVYDEDIAAGAVAGWMCVASGTFENFLDVTGDTDGSTAVITGMTSTSGFAVGMYVAVSAGFASTGPYKIRGVTADSITLDTNSNAAASNITVNTIDPVFKAMAAVAA